MAVAASMVCLDRCVPRCSAAVAWWPVIPRQIGRMTAGIGAGYDRRKFAGAPGTVLELADGLVDESFT